LRSLVFQLVLLLLIRPSKVWQKAYMTVCYQVSSNHPILHF
jgi:hypothetical protein